MRNQEKIWCSLPRECHLVEGRQSQSLRERYDDQTASVLSCYDRMVIT
jgi:hypothetical protein